VKLQLPEGKRKSSVDTSVRDSVIIDIERVHRTITEVSSKIFDEYNNSAFRLESDIKDRLLAEHEEQTAEWKELFVYGDLPLCTRLMSLFSEDLELVASILVIILLLIALLSVAMVNRDDNKSDKIYNDIVNIFIMIAPGFGLIFLRVRRIKKTKIIGAHHAKFKFFRLLFSIFLFALILLLWYWHWSVTYPKFELLDFFIVFFYSILFSLFFTFFLFETVIVSLIIKDNGLFPFTFIMELSSYVKKNFWFPRNCVVFVHFYDIVSFSFLHYYDKNFNDSGRFFFDLSWNAGIILLTLVPEFILLVVIDEMIQRHIESSLYLDRKYNISDLKAIKDSFNIKIFNIRIKLAYYVSLFIFLTSVLFSALFEVIKKSG
jgi:hypothetical protein